MRLPNRGRAARLAIAVVGLSLIYVLSSGPILAVSFLLREATGRDGFYAALYPYYPLLAWGGDPAKAYIEWWVKRFGTVGPG
jgi:hypothetical protein